MKFQSRSVRDSRPSDDSMRHGKPKSCWLCDSQPNYAAVAVHDLDLRIGGIVGPHGFKVVDRRSSRRSRAAFVRAVREVGSASVALCTGVSASDAAEEAGIAKLPPCARTPSTKSPLNSSGCAGTHCVPPLVSTVCSPPFWSKYFDPLFVMTNRLEYVFCSACDPSTVTLSEIVIRTGLAGGAAPAATETSDAPPRAAVTIRTRLSTAFLMATEDLLIPQAQHLWIRKGLPDNAQSLSQRIGRPRIRRASASYISLNSLQHLAQPSSHWAAFKPCKEGRSKAPAGVRRARPLIENRLAQSGRVIQLRIVVLKSKRPSDQDDRLDRRRTR